MVTFKLYVEGGGEGALLDSQFRMGWRQFFEAAGLKGKMPRVVRGGTRSETFRMFATEVANPEGVEVPILVVDSEGPLAEGHSIWQHLTARDKWKRPLGAGENQAFLMVQVMETWLIADRAMLQSYFGPSFREKAIRNWPCLEAVPKKTVLRALQHATAACPKRYAKGKVSFELLGKVKPKLVEEACPQAAALLALLRG